MMFRDRMTFTASLQQPLAGLVDGSDPAGQVVREYHVIGVLEEILITLLQGRFPFQALADDLGLLLHPAAQDRDPGRGRERDQAEGGGHPKNSPHIPPGRGTQDGDIPGRAKQKRKDLARQLSPARHSAALDQTDARDETLDFVATSREGVSPSSFLDQEGAER